MRLLKQIFLTAVVGTLLYSCYPTFDRTTSDFDIVGTTYDDETDFSKLTTFFLEDSVVIIYDTTKDKPEYDQATLDLIISTTRQNLLDNGWTEITTVDSNNVPDVLVVTSATDNTISGSIYYPWYPTYPWYGGYYPYYPWYPGGSVSYYEYTTGTVFIDMIDIAKSDNPTDQGYVIWNALINGILTSTTSNNQSRMVTEINQAFIQSPYLKK